MPKLSDGLTDRKIKKEKPRDKPFKLSDGKGLYLFVNPNGSRWWRFRYVINGREKMLSLGVYPKITLKHAREKALEASRELARGGDPSDSRKQAKRLENIKLKGSFKAVAESWYLHKAKGWATETARKARETLDDTFYPTLANHSIQDITTADFKPVLIALHNRAPRLAVKARQYCNQIIDYAIQEGLRDDGKLLSLKGILPKVAKSHYAAVTKSNDIPTLYKAISGIDSINSRIAVLVCLYTASRPGVVAGMRWDELDLKAKEWHIPAHRMKTGNDHITPLPSQLISLLESLKPLSAGSPFVFPGVRDPIRQHLHRDSLSKVLRENGLRNMTVTHGFRATFRTIARERLKAPADVLEAQLAHAKKDEIQAAYDRSQFLEERHDLIQQWADYIDSFKSDYQERRHK